MTHSTPITHSLYYLSLWLLFTASVYAQQTASSGDEQVLSFTVAEAQDYAIKNSTDALNARLDVEQARYQMKEIIAIGYPQINGSVEYQYFVEKPVFLLNAGVFDGFGDNTALYTGVAETVVNSMNAVIDSLNFPGVEPVNIPPEDLIPPPNPPVDPPSDEDQYIKQPAGTTHNITASVSVSQLIFSGTYFVGLQAASTFNELARKTAIQSEIDIRNNIAKAYYAALVSGESLQVLQDNYSTIERILFETSQLYENGFAEVLDVDRLKLSKNNLEAQITNAERQAELAMVVLKFQMGLDLNADITLSNTLDELVAEEALTAENLKVGKRIELDVLETQDRLNQLDIKQLRAGYLPSLNAFGTYQYSYQSDNFDLGNNLWWFPMTVVGLRLNVPIFDGFQRRATIQQRQIDALKLKNGQKQLKRAIELEVTQAQTTYINAVNQLNNQKENVDLAKRIYDTVLIKYKEGLGSSLEVTQAENELAQTQSMYIQNLYNVLIAKNDLQKAVGNNY